MRKEVFEALGKELKYIGIVFLIVFVVFRIVFFKEGWDVLLRNVASIFWLFMLPGYFIMLYWNEKIGLVERLVIGSLLSGAAIGILSYYSGLAGINVKHHAVVLPVLLIAAGIIFASGRKSS